MRADFPGCNVGFFGHTHAPTLFRAPISRIIKEETDRQEETYSFGLKVEKPEELEFYMGESLTFPPGNKFEIDDDYFYLVNPGSVGQARIADITSYVVFDTIEKTIEFMPFVYNWEEAADAVNKANYKNESAQASIARSLIPENMRETQFHLWILWPIAPPVTCSRRQHRVKTQLKSRTCW